MIEMTLGPPILDAKVPTFRVSGLIQRAVKRIDLSALPAKGSRMNIPNHRHRRLLWRSLQRATQPPHRRAA